MAISTNGTVLARVAGALYNTQMSNATYEEVKTLDPSSLADALFARDFSSATDATVATTLVTNLGLTAVEGLANWVAAQLTAAGSHKGAKVVELLNGFAQMSADATYGAAATAFNTKVDAALALSQTTGNAGGTFAAAGTVSAVSATFTLSTGIDTADVVSASRGTASSTFKFTSGNETINGSVGTLGNDDILLDDTTTDADVLNVNGGTGTFTATNIETINLTTATAATLQLDKVTGTTSVNITGTNTVAADGFAADIFQPTFGINNIKRVVTLQPATLAGTTTEATAETLNVSVSGLSYGTSSSTRSGITIDGKSGAGVDADGVLEVLNLTSTGPAANDFALAFDSGDSVAAINIKGDQSVQIRAISADVSGATVNATANTGTVTLRVDRQGLTMAATNAANWSGVDNILLEDGTAGTDFGVVASLPDASKVTFGSTFNATVTDDNYNSLSVQGATYSALKNSVTVELDNVATIAAGVTLGKLDVQNVKALNLVSSGHAASTSTTGANIIDDLTGDFTTITITGDTSLDLDLNINDTQTASTSTARTVVVTAAGMTGDAFVKLAADANTKVGYTITGSEKDDSITLNDTAGTVAGGAGNDTITGGNGNDTISGGDGDDSINISNGIDSVTGGVGNDTFTAGSAAAISASGEVQVLTVTEGSSTGSLTAHTLFLKTQFGEVAVNIAADTAGSVNSVDSVASAIANQLNTVSNGNYSATTSAGVVTITYVSTLGNVSDLQVKNALSGTYAADVASSVSTTSTALNAYTITAASASTSDAAAQGVTARDVNTTLTDFAIGDVLNIASLTMSGAYFEGASASLGTTTNTTDYGVIVLTGTAYADVTAASTAINVNSDATGPAMVIFLNSTTGKAQAYVDDALGTDAVSGGNASVAFTFDNITTLTGIASTFSTDGFVI